MKYPSYIKSGDYIGLTAPSDGVKEEEDKLRFANAVRKLETSGYTVIETDHVYTALENGSSCDGKTRGDELNQLIYNSRVKLIIAAKGGNYLNEMLPYVDFEAMVEKPTWYMGYSDNTGMTHTLTTKYDIASIYGNNFGDFGMEKWHPAVWEHIDLVEGNKTIFSGYEKYQDGFVDRENPLEGYRLTASNNVHSQTGEDVEFSGRLIGGCLDSLLILQGTQYDGTLDFIEKYKKDGIIWYLESFATDSENLMLFLWKLKDIGWFNYCKGLIIGRPMFYQSFSDTPYEKAFMYFVEALQIPVIFDCDFGHKPPRMPIINGAKAKVSLKEKKFQLEYLKDS